jgi:hypothetical protein
MVLASLCKFLEEIFQIGRETTKNEKPYIKFYVVLAWGDNFGLGSFVCPVVGCMDRGWGG